MGTNRSIGSRQGLYRLPLNLARIPSISHPGINKNHPLAEGNVSSQIRCQLMAGVALHIRQLPTVNCRRHLIAHPIITAEGIAIAQNQNWWNCFPHLPIILISNSANDPTACTGRRALRPYESLGLKGRQQNFEF